MYGCWFYLIVIEKDAEVEFCRFVELPFVPRKGGQILFEEDKDESLSETVKSVCYSIADDVFWIDLEIQSLSDDEEFRCPCSSPEDDCCILRVEWWTERGWQIHEGPRRGNERMYYREWMFEPDKWFGARK